MPEPKRCGAKTRSGAPCKRAPAAGRTRCRMHGGATPVGPALPQFKHGRYSKYLPGGLITRYGESLEDERLVELRDDIALIDVLLSQVVEGAGTGLDVLEQLKELVNAVAFFARVRGDAEHEDAAFQRLLAAEQDAKSETLEAWSSALGLVERRRRLVQTESRRLVALQQTITVERALALVAGIAGVVAAHVTDRRQLADISRDVALLLERERVGPDAPGVPGAA